MGGVYLVTVITVLDLNSTIFMFYVVFCVLECTYATLVPFTSSFISSENVINTIPAI